MSSRWKRSACYPINPCHLKLIIFCENIFHSLSIESHAVMLKQETAQTLGEAKKKRTFRRENLISIFLVFVSAEQEKLQTEFV